MKVARHWRELGPSNLACIHLTSEQWAVIHQVLNQCQFSLHKFLFVKDNECKSRPLILSSSHPSAAHKQYGKAHPAVSLPPPLQPLPRWPSLAVNDIASLIENWCVILICRQRWEVVMSNMERRAALDSALSQLRLTHPAVPHLRNFQVTHMPFLTVCLFLYFFGLDYLATIFVLSFSKFVCYLK